MLYAGCGTQRILHEGDLGMISQYVEAVSRALTGVLEQTSNFALPVAICVGLIVIAGALAFAFGRDSLKLPAWNGRRIALNAFGGSGILLLFVSGWAALRSTQPLAARAIDQRETAEAIANPTPDAPAVYQFSPAVAILRESTYARTLTLPPDFLQRIGTDGVGALTPYLSDPTAENVLRLVDTFRRSGKDVVFTRQVTRLAEEPLPFTSSHVNVQFRRLTGRAYDAEFEARYQFQNTQPTPSRVRFQLSLPDSNTIRDLHVSVAGQLIPDPNPSGVYEWESTLAPNESREAVVRYRTLGARAWHYDLGSRRRRVQEFQLTASGGGHVRFMRGSLQPTSNQNGSLRWKLANIVTAQQIAIAFPPDTAAQESYLNALSALPAALLAFLLGVVVVTLRYGQKWNPALIASGLVLFGLGLGAAPVLANYIGYIAGVLIAPLLGAFLSARLLGRRSLRASVPAALIPATFLSPTHSGLLLLLLSLAALTLLLPSPRSEMLGE
jgi:hypothetical protein